MSDTPRTDALVKRAYNLIDDLTLAVPADWCRDLERENIKLRAALEPFALAAKHITRVSDETGIWATTGTRPEWNYCITVGHIRAAEKALAEA